MFVEAEYFVFEFFVPKFVKSFGDITKDYACGVCVLLGVGYDFMEDGVVVHPLTTDSSLESVVVVVVEVM